MALHVLGAHDLAGAGYLEAPCRALVGLHLGHGDLYSCLENKSESVITFQPAFAGHSR